MNKPVRASDIILRDRFNYLKTLFRQAPLSDSKIRELKTLAEKFDPKNGRVDGKESESLHLTNP